MLDEHILPNTFTPPLHTLPDDVRKSLNQLLESIKSQFTQDKMSIGTTHLTKMQIDMGDLEPVSQKPYPIPMKHYDWIRSEINKLLDVWVIHNSYSRWSAPIIVVPKTDDVKHLVIDYRALNRVTWTFIWPMPRVEDMFSKLNAARYFSTLDLHAEYHQISLEDDYSQSSFHTSIWER